jgi:16S rRNA G966 N2-methylase RsmD
VTKAAPDLPGSAEVFRASAETAPKRLAHLAGRVDLVLADPPYRPAEHEYGAEKLVLDPAFATWAAGALLVVEHAAETPLVWSPRGPWQVVRRRAFGSRCLSFARLRSDD